MSKDLTTSTIDRQNILNNPYAVQEIQKATRIDCFYFEDKPILFKEQIAAFFEVTPRTIDNYLTKYHDELKENGYQVLRGNRLKNLKIELEKQHVDETIFVNIKTPQTDDAEELKLEILHAIS
jgi:hypothetical protein